MEPTIKSRHTDLPTSSASVVAHIQHVRDDCGNTALRQQQSKGYCNATLTAWHYNNIVVVKH